MHVDTLTYSVYDCCLDGHSFSHGMYTGGQDGVSL